MNLTSRPVSGNYLAVAIVVLTLADVLVTAGRNAFANPAGKPNVIIIYTDDQGTIDANRHDLWRNGVEIWEDGRFFPDMMTEECEKFLEENKDKPFFLYWANNVPHYPLQGTAKWREEYKDLPAPRRMYAAFVSTLDERIGRIVNKVDELGIRDRTLIIFQSDNGHSTETRTFGGGGNAGHFRGAKECFFEGGIRMPSIVSMPGTIPQGEVRGQMVTGCDWKLLGNPKDNSHKAELTAQDKLFLCNLAEDVTEMKNLAADNPEVVRRLKELHEKYVEDTAQE